MTKIYLTPLLQGWSCCSRQIWQCDLCVFFSTTYHITFCIYCLSYNRQPAALDSVAVFWGKDRCGMWSSCFLFSRRTEEGRVRCYCESYCLQHFKKGDFGIYEQTTVKTQHSAATSVIPPPPPPPHPCSMNFRLPKVLKAIWRLFAGDGHTGTCCSCSYKVIHSPWNQQQPFHSKGRSKTLDGFKHDSEGRKGEAVLWSAAKSPGRHDSRMQ